MQRFRFPISQLWNPGRPPFEPDLSLPPNTVSFSVKRLFWPRIHELTPTPAGSLGGGFAAKLLQRLNDPSYPLPFRIQFSQNFVQIHGRRERVPSAEIFGTFFDKSPLSLKEGPIMDKMQA